MKRGKATMMARLWHLRVRWLRTLMYRSFKRTQKLKLELSLARGMRLKENFRRRKHEKLRGERVLAEREQHLAVAQMVVELTQRLSDGPQKPEKGGETYPKPPEDK
jgi:hypothetical protein